MFDRLLFALILETIGESIDDTRREIDFPQKQPTGIRSQCAPVKITNDGPPSKPLKVKLVFDKLFLYS